MLDSVTESDNATRSQGTCIRPSDDKVNAVTTPQKPPSSGGIEQLRARYVAPASAAATPPQVSPPQEAPVPEPYDPNAQRNADPYGVHQRQTPSQWAGAPQQVMPSAEESADVQFHPVTPSYSSFDNDDYSRDDDYRVNSKRDRPQMGLRAFLANRLHVPVGKGKAELEYDALIARINRSLLAPKVIGVLGGKGGVGKTSTVMALASTLSEHRSKPVVAITLDYNDTLSLRTKAVSSPARGNLSLLDFSIDRSIRTPNDVASCMKVNKHRLSVLGTGINALRHEVLTPEQYLNALDILKRNYELIVVDFGNAPNTDTFWTSLESLDAMVLVTSTENDSLQGTKRVEDVARDAGLLDLMDKQTTILVNHRTPADPKVDLDHFVGRMHAVKDREVLGIPWDDHISESGPVDLDLLAGPTRYQYVRAAALVVTSLPN